MNFVYQISPRRSTPRQAKFTAYTPAIVTLTDERGKVRTKYFDAHRKLKQLDEVNGSETYVTTYAYDTAGSLTTVINHPGHTTRMAYDMLGRKTAMCNPNMGTASWNLSISSIALLDFIHRVNNVSVDIPWSSKILSRGLSI